MKTNEGKVSVTLETKGTITVVGRFKSVQLAEAFIAKLEKTDPVNVHNGNYSINPPESHR